MEYTNEIIIDVPRETVVETLVDHERMQQWSPNLTNFEHIQGPVLTEGAKTKLIFQTNQGPMEMFETILKIDLPETFHCLYESEGVKNWSHNTFIALNPEKTKWRADNKFEFDFVPDQSEEELIDSFHAQTQQDMEEFKEFVEKRV